MRFWFIALIAAAALLLAGCGRQQLYTGLQEREANEMIAALQSADIGSAKVDQGKSRWAVEVSQQDFGRAVAVLRARGLPRPQFDTLGTVFKKSGFGDNVTEAHARYIHARQQEMMQALHKIDGVVDASVELSIPQKDRLAEAVTAPSASVLIKYRPGTNLQARAGDIKGLVANGIEGLTYDRVNVVMFRAEEPGVVADAPRGISLLALVAIIGAVLMTGLAWLGLRRRGSANRALARRTP